MSTLSFYRGKRVLVTGSTGFLATALIAALTTIDCTIVRLSRPGARFVPLSGAARDEQVTGSLQDRAVWKHALAGSDVVFHLAAQTSSAVANADPLADLTSNGLPIIHLLETCRECGWSPTLVFAGTSTQIGIPTRLPVDETHGDVPTTVYDVHKLLAEQYIHLYTQRQLIRGTTLRLTNVYGPGPRSSSQDRGILNLMIRRALRGEPLTVYGAGAYVRDYIFVDDVVAAFLSAGASIDRLTERYYVLGSGHGTTIRDAMQLVAERVAHVTGVMVPVVSTMPTAPLLPIEERNFVADTTRFSAATGWSPQIGLWEGIDRTIAALVDPIECEAAATS